MWPEVQCPCPPSSCPGAILFAYPPTGREKRRKEALVFDDIIVLSAGPTYTRKVIPRRPPRWWRGDHVFVPAASMSMCPETSPTASQKQWKTAQTITIKEHGVGQRGRLIRRLRWGAGSSFRHNRAVVIWYIFTFPYATHLRAGPMRQPRGFLCLFSGSSQWAQTWPSSVRKQRRTQASRGSRGRFDLEKVLPSNKPMVTPSIVFQIAIHKVAPPCPRRLPRLSKHNGRGTKIRSSYSRSTTGRCVGGGVGGGDGIPVGGQVLQQCDGPGPSIWFFLTGQDLGRQTVLALDPAGVWMSPIGPKFVPQHRSRASPSGPWGRLGWSKNNAG